MAELKERHATEIEAYSKRVAALEQKLQQAQARLALVSTPGSALERIAALENQIRITNSAYEAYQQEKERVHVLAMTQAAQDIRDLEQEVRALAAENDQLQSHVQTFHMAKAKAQHMRRTLRTLHPAQRKLAVVDMIKSAQHHKLRKLQALSDALSRHVDERRAAGPQAPRPAPLTARPAPRDPHLEITFDKFGSTTELVSK